MLEKFKKFGMLNLGVELSRNDQKKIMGGGDCCGGYCSCSGGGGGTTIPSGSKTVCTGGTYQIGCQPAYCAAAYHGTFVTCTN